MKRARIATHPDPCGGRNPIPSAKRSAPVPTWVKPFPGGWLLLVHVQPNAKQSEIGGLHGDALKVRVAAAPTEGRANEELVALLAAALGVPKKNVAVFRGMKSRQKTVSIAAPHVDPSLLLRPRTRASGD